MKEFVDPFIGVDNWGSCLCGPYLPLSLVRPGPDTAIPHPPNGYQSGQPIIRFSHTHVSGTGGEGRYGNIGILPFITDVHTAQKGYIAQQEQAGSGYYHVMLEPAHIKAELTATSHVGVHRYTFPDGAEAQILLDAGSVIQTSREDSAHSISGHIEWISTTEIVGRADLQGGWGHQFPYSIYFYAHFDQEALQRTAYSQDDSTQNLFAVGPNCQALASFGLAHEVNLSVGISYVSIAKARANVEQEVGQKSFSQIHAEAVEIWEHELSRICVSGGTVEQKTLFYTLFTRLLCMPGDLGVDDENPSWHSGVRQFTDFYCVWDSVRNANALITLFHPDLEIAFLNALLDIAEHTGWLPDAWIAGHSAKIQGGSSADILFCEAALKGLQGIDYQKALHYMRKNNEVQSPDPLFYGRYLQDYSTLGYVSTDVPLSSVSKHLEYTYQDWCIGTLAMYLKQYETAQEYHTYSQRVWNLWRDDLHTFAPKNHDGSWVEPFDPTHKHIFQWLDPYFYEGNSWQWSFNVQQDFAGLIERHGGTEAFIQHLDTFFELGYYASKEIMLHTPYLYIYAGRPDKTAERVYTLLQQHFHATRDGLSDNEDMGCQSAWYMCSSMGLYPVMGQDLYLLTPPAFKRIKIALGNEGSHLIIEAPEAGERQRYIVGATLNGLPLQRAWLRHHEIVHGGVLHFTLADQPGSWGEQEIPPLPQIFARYSSTAPQTT
ncbi:GH92 family glycosyl hydrolase [Dictyobacter kobayashii]|uniref:Alpha-1,2-mannosidase n=1 Tax=Dictyobacter kobayashii TaxID=2014872 RepID=A0A402ADD9_9CHLR|nr:GH92 family glycosyl hydrolase [Dictyobacter kobayashii]GCE17127.1 hypothetical protein KDK_09270 [Dictyobacter kobayashii]